MYDSFVVPTIEEGSDRVAIFCEAICDHLKCQFVVSCLRVATKSLYFLANPSIRIDQLKWIKSNSILHQFVFGHYKVPRIQKLKVIWMNRWLSSLCHLWWITCNTFSVLFLCSSFITMAISQKGSSWFERKWTFSL